MAEPRHHSIGEVLSLLKEEHNDITISKIRFFESQGLIDPERTPSGYRKFYDHDIDRLRWILTQQRDHFLPLKVIKRRLEEAGFDPAAEVAPSTEELPEPTLFTRDEGADPAGTVVESPDASAADAEQADDDTEPADPAVPDAPQPQTVAVATAPPIADGDPLAVDEAAVSLTAAELAAAAGIDLGFVADLERVGLIETVAGAEPATYDGEALVVAKAAAVFRARGFEPRHLRMFKVAAERQAGLLEQLLGAKLKRGGDSRQEAREELNELVRLGEALQRSVLRRNFGRHLD